MNNNNKEQELDQLLDSALAQYGAAEPLHGLEDRVVGRLRGRQAQRAWWMWGGAAAAVALSIVVAVLLGRPVEQKPGTATTANVSASVAPQSTPKVVSGATEASAKPRGDVVAAQKHGLVRTGLRPEVAKNTLPRRDIFPTPAPPTEQELLLARYVRVTPRAEVLAQANRKPLEFHEDPLSAPADGGGGASPQKAQGTK